MATMEFTVAAAQAGAIAFSGGSKRADLPSVASPADLTTEYVIAPASSNDYYATITTTTYNTGYGWGWGGWGYGWGFGGWGYGLGYGWDYGYGFGGWYGGWGFWPWWGRHSS